MQAPGRSRDRASGKLNVMRLPATEIVFPRIELVVKQNGQVRNAHRTIDEERFRSRNEMSDPVNFLRRKGRRGGWDLSSRIVVAISNDKLLLYIRSKKDESVAGSKRSRKEC